MRLSCLSLAIAIAVTGCSHNPTSPTIPPSQTADAQASQPTYTLSGIVFAETATGPAPIEGARVIVNGSGPQSTTGKDGRYSISGLSAVSNVITVSGWGIAVATKTVVITGDTTFDIQVLALPSYTLSGMVFERTSTETEPIEGVELYCDACGSPFGHTFVYTDANGFYSFSYAYDGINALLIRKDGYTDPVGQPQGPVQGRPWRQPVVNGDTHFDIELVRQ